jgi:predicted ATP-grasp superfamily ATP-dependent carboligase
VLADALRRHRLPALDVRHDAPPAGDGRAWLVKPLSSGGGVGIRPYVGQQFEPKTHYLQEYCPGARFGALFLGMPDGTCLLLGMTHQLEAGSFNAPEFHYCGSVGPLSAVPAELQSLGNVLVREFGLRGLFGVDLVYRVDPETGRGACLPLEVNPRYTASVEVLERAYGVSLLDLHRAVFEDRPIAWRPPPASAVIWGKVILYARRDLVFPSKGPWLETLRQRPGAEDAEQADIPHPGERIARGRPVLTVFASGQSIQKCLLGLREKLQDLDRCLWG